MTLLLADKLDAETYGQDKRTCCLPKRYFDVSRAFCAVEKNKGNVRTMAAVCRYFAQYTDLPKDQ